MFVSLIFINVFILIIVALTNEEILSQAFVFLVGGYETTSALMSFFFYVMATEPEIQEKIYEEIHREFADVKGEKLRLHCWNCVVSSSGRCDIRENQSINLSRHGHSWNFTNVSAICSVKFFVNVFQHRFWQSEEKKTKRLDSIVSHQQIINSVIIKSQKDLFLTFLFIVFIMILRIGLIQKNFFQNGEFLSVFFTWFVTLFRLKIFFSWKIKTTSDGVSSVWWWSSVKKFCIVLELLNDSLS